MLAEFIGVVWYVTGQFLHNVFLDAIVLRCITSFFMWHAIMRHTIMWHTSTPRFFSEFSYRSFFKCRALYNCVKKRNPL